MDNEDNDIHNNNNYATIPTKRTDKQTKKQIKSGRK